jgi:dTDP-4-dehydrorhamnose 3,5-epimerase-like enzyme
MKLIEIKTNIDSRGHLTPIEGSTDVPFEIKRCYIVHHMVAARGGHAHIDTQQLVIATAGTVRLELRDGRNSHTFRLETPSQGLLIDPMTWIEISDFSDNAALLVIASTHYDHHKTIRDWNYYITLKRPNYE